MSFLSAYRWNVAGDFVTGGLDRYVLVLAEIDARVTGAEQFGLQAFVTRQRYGPVGVVPASAASALVVPATAAAAAASFLPAAVVARLLRFLPAVITVQVTVPILKK